MCVHLDLHARVCMCVLCMFVAFVYVFSWCVQQVAWARVMLRSGITCSASAGILFLCSFSFSLILGLACVCALFKGGRSFARTPACHMFLFVMCFVLPDVFLFFSILFNSIQSMTVTPSTVICVLFLYVGLVVCVLDSVLLLAVLFLFCTFLMTCTLSLVRCEDSALFVLPSVCVCVSEGCVWWRAEWV